MKGENIWEGEKVEYCTCVLMCLSSHPPGYKIVFTLLGTPIHPQALQYKLVSHCYFQAIITATHLFL